MYNKQNNENSDNMTIDISIKIWFILQVLLNVKFIMASFNQKNVIYNVQENMVTSENMPALSDRKIKKKYITC